MLTYGDGVANINLIELLSFHKKHGKLATITAAQPPGRFGSLEIELDRQVKVFNEKPPGDNSWVNAGFFVLEDSVLDYIRDDKTIWEKEPLENLANNHELYAYKHQGFWKPMDTLRDKRELEELWKSGKAPWMLQK